MSEKIFNINEVGEVKEEPTVQLGQINQSENGVFQKFEIKQEVNPEDYVQAGSIENRNPELPAKKGLWSKFKTMWFTAIGKEPKYEVKLTPFQQNVENDLNNFMTKQVKQEKFWNKVYGFLFNESGENTQL